MENQVKKSVLNSFTDFFRRLWSFVSPKQRSYKLHLLETMKIMDRILEIKKRRPELSKYLNAMPKFPSNSTNSKIRLADFIKYQNNLLELLEKYELELQKEPWFI